MSCYCKHTAIVQAQCDSSYTLWVLLKYRVLFMRHQKWATAFMFHVKRIKCQWLIAIYTSSPRTTSNCIFYGTTWQHLFTAAPVIYRRQNQVPIKLPRDFWSCIFLKCTDLEHLAPPQWYRCTNFKSCSDSFPDCIDEWQGSLLPSQGTQKRIVNTHSKEAK